MRAAVVVALCICAAGAAPPPARFVGAERCKLCHRAVYEAWRRTPHARASEAIAGVSENADCARCHATGPARLPGVQCEACHGPGERYWPAEIMMDPVKARLAGLVDPTEATCRRCHGLGPPGHADSFAMPPEEEKSRSIH